MPPVWLVIYAGREDFARLVVDGGKTSAVAQIRVGGKRWTAREASNQQELWQRSRRARIPQAKMKREFKPTGVVCTIEVPLLSASDT
jgi:hypothetical protein